MYLTHLIYILYRIIQSLFALFLLLCLNSYHFDTGFPLNMLNNLDIVL
jgi:hypothetical protein